jgi:hypothetical protein
MPRITAKEFEEFVKRQKSSVVAEPPVDWDKERRDWLAHLDSLYKKVESFLKKYKDEGSVEIDYKETELFEENLGTYPVKTMVIRIGRQVTNLTPVGTLLVGSKGRVDVDGPYGKAALVLVDKDAVSPRPRIRVRIIDPKEKVQPEIENEKKIEWVWKIATPPPALQYIDLNAESFLQLIMEISNA